MAELRELKIDMADLKSFFDDASGLADYYLNIETGEIEFDSEDDKFERIGDDGESPYDDDERYLRVPHGDSREGYKDMEAFIETIEDSRIQDTLYVAIDGSGAFARFKSVLYRYPNEQKRWFDFKDKRLARRVVAWLKSHGIKPLPFPQDMDEEEEDDEEIDLLESQVRLQPLPSLWQKMDEGKTSDLLELTSQDVTPALIALLDRTLPSAFRAMAVLEGECKGRIWTDDSANPTWLIAQEGVFGTLFWSGAVTAEILQPLIAQLSQTGHVKVGLWPDDTANRALLPPNPMYEGQTLDFTNRPLHQGLDAFLQVPDGLHLRRVDRKLFARSIDVEFYINMLGSVENVLEKALGLFLMQGDDILCEAFAGTSAMGIIEIGINTREHARQKGYATLTSAHLIRACESLGYQTYWNTSKQNTVSAHMARKLGYRTEREYLLFAWFPPKA